MYKNLIYSYDPKIQRRVVYAIKGNKMISLVTGHIKEIKKNKK